MVAIGREFLQVEDQTLSATAGDVIATSGALSPGTQYLILASGSAQTTAAGQTSFANLTVGGTVYARQGSTQGFANPFAQTWHANSGPLGAVFSYTPAAADVMEFQAWTAVAGSPSAYLQALALDMSNVPASAWQSYEGANSDTIVTTPGAAASWTTVDSAITVNSEGGRFLILASCEAVPTATADEISLRLVVDGVPTQGSLVRHDANPDPTNQVYGYLTHDIQTLAAGAHTVEIQAEGTGANGGVGHRRVRIHVLHESAFEDEDIQQDLLGGGNLASGPTDQIFAASAPTATVPRDYLLLAHTQKQVNYWTNNLILVNGSYEPGGGEIYGFSTSAIGLGNSATGDLLYEQGMHLALGLTSADTLGLRIRKTAGGTVSYGDQTPRDEGQNELSLIAVRLEVADTGGDADGSGAASGTLTVGSVPVALSGSAGGTSSASGDLSRSAFMSGTLAGSSAASGTLNYVEQAQGDASGDADASGTLTVTTTTPLSGDAAGLSAAGGSGSLVDAGQGGSAGVGDLGGSLSSDASLSDGTPTDVDGQGAASGTLTVTSPGSGSGGSAGSGGASGGLSTTHALTGAADGSSSASANAAGVIPLSGAAGGSSEIAATTSFTEFLYNDLRALREGVAFAPWWVNAGDDAVTVRERLIENGNESAGIESTAADITGYTSVSVERWDASTSAWVLIPGNAEAIQSSDLDADGVAYYDLVFTPATGALESLPQGPSRRRWHVTIGDRDVYIPSRGHNLIVVNRDPTC
ncbi:MAG: hypothetical protein AAFP15_15985 [Bacteroidota bacterium]